MSAVNRLYGILSLWWNPFCMFEPCLLSLCQSFHLPRLEWLAFVCDFLFPCFVWPIDTVLSDKVKFYSNLHGNSSFTKKTFDFIWQRRPIFKFFKFDIRHLFQKMWSVWTPNWQKMKWCHFGRWRLGFRRTAPLSPQQNLDIKLDRQFHEL